MTIAAITDGTSNTMSLGEYAWGKTANAGWGWWNSGNYGDSLYTSSYPMNPFNKSANEGTGAGINTGSDWICAASSFHPGGANFSFCDGSVKFIKDSIQQPQQGVAPGGTTVFALNIAYQAGNTYTVISPMSVYQALFDTRRGRSHQLRRLLRESYRLRDASVAFSRAGRVAGRFIMPRFVGSSSVIADGEELPSNRRQSPMRGTLNRRHFMGSTALSSLSLSTLAIGAAEPKPTGRSVPW